MDKKFLPMMGLMAFGLIGANDLKANESPSIKHLPTTEAIENAYANVKESGPVRNPPTAAEIQKAYDNCLKHECEDFAEWSIKAAEVCSEGGEECCQRARELLEEIHSSHVGEVIYDNYFPHSFEGDDEPGNAP